MDDQEFLNHDERITSEKINQLKQKYSQELKDNPDNPIKIIMKLIFEGATERNLEKRLSISFTLSEILTKPDGIINLFLALIDFDSSSQKITTHNQRFVAVANIITCLPKICMSYEDYSKNIYKQLKPLLVNQNSKYSSLASIIIKALLDSPHAKKYGDKIQQLIIRSITEAFSQPSKEYQLDMAIVAVHNLVLNHIPVEFFIDVFPYLIIAAQTLCNSPSNLKPMLQAIMTSLLNGMQPGPACCLIERTLFHCDIRSDIYTISPQDDGVSIKFDENPSKSRTEDSSHITEETIISLVKSSENELLILEFYFHFQNAIWTARDSYQRELSVSLIEPFLEESSRDGPESELDIFSIIANNRQKSLELVARTLLNHKEYLSSKDHDQALRLDLIESSMSSCISILEVLSATLCDRDDETVVLTKCHPILRDLIDILSDISNDKSKPLVKSIESFLDKLDDLKSHDMNNKIRTKQECEFEAIIKELNDKLIPVRVHALVKLKQMILFNDPLIVSKIPQIYSMVECSLADREPYVFLACINLMAEMAVRDTVLILPKLIELYSNQEIELQNRINAGEVLIRLVKQLNETTPHYAQQVMNCLITHSQDPEKMMRMSSLTNMGEICRNLGCSMGKYMVEILVRIRSILDTDALEVKCAAIDLLRTTLSGVDIRGAEAIQRELKELYVILRRIRGVVLDDKLCLQIDLALDEIDRIAREMLVGPQSTSSQRGTDKITKNIKVLSLL